MFRHLFPFRRLLATSFLLVFVNVFVGQCWCATGGPVSAATVASYHKQPAKPSHPGCHGHGGALAKQKGKAKHSHEKSGVKHDCCKDKSASLLSSLSGPSHKHLLMPAPAVLPTATAFHFRPRAGKWDRTGAVALVRPRHLKPKIPDIRIFIQSLTV